GVSRTGSDQNTWLSVERSRARASWVAGSVRLAPRLRRGASVIRCHLWCRSASPYLASDSRTRSRSGELLPRAPHLVRAARRSQWLTRSRPVDPSGPVLGHGLVPAGILHTAVF